MGIILCFAFITGTILISGFLVAGAQMSVQAGMDRLGADMVVIPYDPYARSSGMFLTGTLTHNYFNGSVLDDVEATPGVLRASPEVYVTTLNDVNWSRYSVLLIGFDPASDFSIKPILEQAPQTDLQADQVYVGYYIQGDVGAQIDVAGIMYTIAGRLERTGFSPDLSVYFIMGEAYQVASRVPNFDNQTVAKAGDISAVLVKADRSMGIDPVLYWITSLNPGVLVYPMSSIGQQVSDQLTSTTQALYLTTASVIIVSLPLVALISTNGVNERRREIGILRAMGATRTRMFQLVFVEAVVLAIIGGLLGAAGGSAALILLQGSLTEGMGTSFMWPSLPAILSNISFSLLVGVALAGLAALWPAYSTSRLDPYDSLRRN